MTLALPGSAECPSSGSAVGGTSLVTLFSLSALFLMASSLLLIHQHGIHWLWCHLFQVLDCTLKLFFAESQKELEKFFNLVYKKVHM